MSVAQEGISSVQRNLLEKARAQPPLPVLLSILSKIATDSDITKEREPVHPEWLDVFESIRNQLPEYSNSFPVARVVTFFDRLRPLDKSISQLDPESLNLSFLLGAGASKPSPSNIPTVKELLPQLLERARRLDRDDVTKLANFCERQQIDNIEDLLTAAQLATFCSRNPTALSLMNHLLYRGDDNRLPFEDEAYGFYERDFGRRPFRGAQPRGLPVADLSSIAFLQDTLQVLFGLLSSTMLPARPNEAHKAIAAYAKAHPGVSIVTTNYDCCMDLALKDVQRDPKYSSDFANVHVTRDEGGNVCNLIKLHGSLNWYYCETCQEVRSVDI